MKVKATIRIRFPSRRQLEIALNSLEPEIKSQTAKRSKVTMETDGAFLIMDVEAKDTIALRAALNAYLRWIDSTKNVLELLHRI